MGLVRADDSPPIGAETWGRPELRVGDAFTYVRGGSLRMEYVVGESREAQEIELLLEGMDTRFILDRDLGVLREADANRPTSAKQPVDPQFNWPLWVGKTWVGEFVPWDQDAGAAPYVVRVEYRCDAVERIQTAAGTFEALRIWRFAAPRENREDYLSRDSVYWYVPELGYFVKWLDSGSVTELIDYRRLR